jgi:hypothetical protein
MTPISDDVSTHTLPLAEILESSTVGWLAQCRELHCAPPFGSFVRAPEDERRAIIYGVVSHIETVPFDASRRPLALWTREDELPQKHPQIGKLLRTTFTARCVGWSEGGNFVCALPQQPPRLHSFVLPCEDDEVRRFTEKLTWIRPLLENSSPGGASSDELLIAACREAVRVNRDNPRYVVRLGQELALLLRADYLRLRTVLSRISS